MKAVLIALASALRASVRSRAALQLEVFALRHQLAVYQRRGVRARSRSPIAFGQVVEVSEAGGFYRHYERRAA